MQFGIKYLGQIKTYLKGKDKLQNVWYVVTYQQIHQKILFNTTNHPSL